MMLSCNTLLQGRMNDVTPASTLLSMATLLQEFKCIPGKSLNDVLIYYQCCSQSLDQLVLPIEQDDDSFRCWMLVCARVCC